MQYKRLNPVTGDVASVTSAMTVSEVLTVADKAASSFPGWAAAGPNARRAILMKASEALEARQEAFTKAMVDEIGATPGWAIINLKLAATMVREAASLTTQIQGEVIPSDKPGCLAMTLREPVGVILAIAPWNAPIILGVRAIVTALACGNSVILKASEACPRTHELIVEAFHEAGFPEGVVNIVTNAPESASEVVGALIDHPGVKRINFTGSTTVGKIIAKRAAEHLKPCLLELGGKAPLIILDDANIDEAVKAAVFGAFMNSGQICMSTERIIVTEGIADKFVSKLRKKVETLKAGDPSEGGNQLGAVFDQVTVSRVNSLVDDALEKGGTLLVGEKSDNVIMQAVVIDNVTNAMKIYSDESFGPVVGIIRAKNSSDAVRLANDSEYGLSAAIFTSDVALGLKLARQIKSGMCHINGATVHDEAQMPFGGVGASGYGRFGGKAGIDSFTELRWITIETQKCHYPI